jgi:hypothetical protein
LRRVWAEIFPDLPQISSSDLSMQDEKHGGADGI